MSSITHCGFDVSTSAERAYPEITKNYEKVERLTEKYYIGPTMEGLYIKWEEDDEVKGRYKFVRGDFVSHVAGQEEHWHDRPILQNQLVEGALERMFEVK